MSGLPTLIPPQSVPISVDGQGAPAFLNINWYLFLYNLGVQVLGTGSGGGGTTPVSPFDALDAANLFAQGADVPQAYRGLENLATLIAGGALVDPSPRAQPAQNITVGASPFTYTALHDGTLSVSNGVASSIVIIRQGIVVPTGITLSSAGVIGALTDEKGSGGLPGFVAGTDFTPGTTTALTLSQAYGSASNLWIAFDAAEQGPNTYSLSGTTLTFNAPIPVGTANVFVKGAVPSTLSSLGGLIPLRRLDQVRITYTGLPLVVFLPD